MADKSGQPLPTLVGAMPLLRFRLGTNYAASQFVARRRKTPAAQGKEREKPPLFRMKP